MFKDKNTHCKVPGNEDKPKKKYKITKMSTKFVCPWSMCH